MFRSLLSGAVVGLNCLPVEVEVDLQRGQTSFTIVGLADASIKEAKDRIYAALKNSNFDYPFNYHVVINLAPADLAKEGSAYDLPMATALIAATYEQELDTTNALIVGELALDGAVRHSNGILPLALFARERQIKRLFVPYGDAAEAALVPDIAIFPVKTVRELIEHLSGDSLITPFERPTLIAEPQSVFQLDFALIKGQEFAKRGLEIAAAGSHNILLNGPPGAGKTLLARSLPSILPPLTRAESLEVTAIYSVAGLLREPIVVERPFRSPHHTASGAALVGGGRIPRPGEITLAHRGVLFLDEFPEFPRFAIENLRQPLEDGTITISRAQGAVSFPARFVLVASQNPCPCGFATDAERACSCSPLQVVRYQKKISGPLLDRIDLFVEVPRVKFEKLRSTDLAEPSAAIRERVMAGRERQAERFRGTTLHTNSEMGNSELRAHCHLDEASLGLLKNAVHKMQLSARSFNRLLKLSRTIADLAASDDIKLDHVAEALQFRMRVE